MVNWGYGCPTESDNGLIIQDPNDLPDAITFSSLGVYSPNFIIVAASPIPEPSSGLLLGLGAIGVAARRGMFSSFQFNRN